MFWSTLVSYFNLTCTIFKLKHFLTCHSEFVLVLMILVDYGINSSVLNPHVLLCLFFHYPMIPTIISYFVLKTLWILMIPMCYFRVCNYIPLIEGSNWKWHNGQNINKLVMIIIINLTYSAISWNSIAFYTELKKIYLKKDLIIKNKWKKLK